jgi:tRNA-dihydrouridine synthase B
LAGYTDLPFRRPCRRHGCRYAFTPLIDAGALVYGNRHNARILLRGEDEPWLGVQLLGSDPALLASAVRRLDAMPFDCIDFNLGCPVKKVVLRGAGAALARERDAALRCVEAIIANTSKPVTVKTRILDERDPAPTVEFALALQACGIRGLTLHGRLAERLYSGPVATAVLRAVREALDIPLIANGGVMDRESALALARETGCAALMIARGAIGNPWIFRQLAEPSGPPPTHEEICGTMREHVEGMVALYGEEIALRNARKIILAYLVGRGYRRSLRARVTGICTLAEFHAFRRVVEREGPVSGGR